MGFVFTIIASVFLLLFSLSFFILGRILRRKNRIIANILNLFSILTTVPLLITIAIFILGLYKSNSLEREYEINAGKLISAIVYGHSKKAQSLIDRGYDISRSNLENGNTALHEACMVNNKDVVRKLIEKKVDLNTTNNNDETALLSCIHYMDNEMLNLLVENGADVNIPNDNGDNAILKIVKYIEFGEHKYEKIKTLLKYNCDAGKRDINGKSPLDYVRTLVSSYENKAGHDSSEKYYTELIRIRDLLNNA